MILKNRILKEAFLENREYKFIVDEQYGWSTWACPKESDGKLDIINSTTSDDLKDFVNQDLFPYLRVLMTMPKI